MMPKLRSHPLLILLLWLVAAFVVIGAGPRFLPITGSTVSFEAVLWKLFGAALFLAASFYLLRQRPGFAVLGLEPNRRAVSLFVLGVFGGIALVTLWVAVFNLVVPFHLAPGIITAEQAIYSFCIYFFGALIEELAFRGHPFIRLRERYGTLIGIAFVSLAFGVLHLPGMVGPNAIKIIVMTGLSSVLFCLAYLRTRSLWAAIGLHAGMNFMLHTVLGAGGGRGPSLLRPVYEQSAPAGYDPAFWSFVLVLLAFSTALLLLWPRKSPAFGRS